MRSNEDERFLGNFIAPESGEDILNDDKHSTVSRYNVVKMKYNESEKDSRDVCVN